MTSGCGHTALPQACNAFHTVTRNKIPAIPNDRKRNGYALWEDKATGALAGYNGSGEHVGKWSDGTEAAELPAAVIVAYMMSNDPGWQRVERKSKGKRDRGARDQCAHS